MEGLQIEIFNLLMILITSFIGVVCSYATIYLKRKGFMEDVKRNKATVKIVVKAIDQMYSHLHGTEKLELAKIELTRLMNEKKLKISEGEINLLIEYSIGEIKDSIKKAIDK